MRKTKIIISFNLLSQQDYHEVPLSKFKFRLVKYFKQALRIQLLGFLLLSTHNLQVCAVLNYKTVNIGEYTYKLRLYRYTIITAAIALYLYNFVPGYKVLISNS